ncbi:MAG: gamma-glutamyltransferase, partial [Gemmatimonadales bacterium]|nr:gamma-glutamyltransferase [Gemmatimonadales bacterium]
MARWVPTAPPMMPPMMAPLLLPPSTRPTIAPAAVPPATLATSFASVPDPSSLVRTPEIVATIGISFPFTSTPTASSVSVPVVSLLLSDGLIAVTLSTTFDPAGQLYLVVGTPGGPRIITMVYHVISNVIDHRMPLPEAVAAPRMHHQALPDSLRVEEGG